METKIGLFILIGLITGTAVLAATDVATDEFTITVNEIAVLDVAGVLGNFTVTAPATGGDSVRRI